MRRTFLIICLTLATTQAHAQIISQNYLADFFGPIQEKSIAEKREYCGYFGMDEDGELIASKPTAGSEDSCLAEPNDDMVEVIASYHTHGAFHLDADAETPSSADLEADISEEIDGYVATPGGRIWKNELESEKAILMCGRNCTVSDPDYDDAAFPPVDGSYTLNALYARDEADY